MKGLEKEREREESQFLEVFWRLLPCPNFSLHKDQNSANSALRHIDRASLTLCSSWMSSMIPGFTSDRSSSRGFRADDDAEDEDEALVAAAAPVTGGGGRCGDGGGNGGGSGRCSIAGGEDVAAAAFMAAAAAAGYIGGGGFSKRADCGRGIKPPFSGGGCGCSCEEVDGGAAGDGVLSSPSVRRRRRFCGLRSSANAASITTSLLLPWLFEEVLEKPSRPLQRNDCKSVVYNTWNDVTPQPLLED